MAEQPTPHPFGFAVYQQPIRRYPAGDDQDQPGWAVSLPHQCDRWGITGDAYYAGMPHTVAVAALERFIAEAQAALEALRAEQPYGDPNG